MAVDTSTSAPKGFLNDPHTPAQVVAAKPAAAVDFCFLSADVNFTTPITDAATCDADPRLIPRASPRQIAGGPLAENILKCQLKPLVFSDYTGVTFTAGQQSRLSAVFPTGVCDWTKPGVGQQDPVSPLTFAAGPGGVPGADVDLALTLSTGVPAVAAAPCAATGGCPTAHDRAVAATWPFIGGVA